MILLTSFTMALGWPIHQERRGVASVSHPQTAYPEENRFRTVHGPSSRIYPQAQFTDRHNYNIRTRGVR